MPTHRQQTVTNWGGLLRYLATRRAPDRLRRRERVEPLMAEPASPCCWQPESTAVERELARRLRAIDSAAAWTPASIAERPRRRVHPLAVAAMAASLVLAASVGLYFATDKGRTREVAVNQQTKTDGRMLLRADGEILDLHTRKRKTIDLGATVHEAGREWAPGINEIGFSPDGKQVVGGDPTRHILRRDASWAKSAKTGNSTGRPTARRSLSAPASVEDAHWGKPVKGGQVPLRVDKTKWPMGELPELKVDLRFRTRCSAAQLGLKCRVTEQRATRHGNVLHYVLSKKLGVHDESLPTCFSSVNCCPGQRRRHQSRR